MCSSYACLECHHGATNCHSCRFFWNDSEHEVCGKDFWMGVMVDLARAREPMMAKQDGDGRDIIRMQFRTFMDAAERHMGPELTAGPDPTRWLASLVRYIRHERAVYWNVDVQQKRFAWLENDNQVLVVDIYGLLGYVCDSNACRGANLPWNERFQQCPFIHVPDYDQFYTEAKELWGIRPTDRRLMSFVFLVFPNCFLLTRVNVFRNWRRGNDDDVMPSTRFLPHFVDTDEDGRVARMIADLCDFYDVRCPQLFRTEPPFPWAEERVRPEDSGDLGACKMAREWTKEWLDVARGYFRMLKDLMLQANRNSTVVFRVSYADGRHGWDTEIQCHDGDEILDLLHDVERDLGLRLGEKYVGRGVENGRLECNIRTRCVPFFVNLVTR